MIKPNNMTNNDNGNINCGCDRMKRFVSINVQRVDNESNDEPICNWCIVINVNINCIITNINDNEICANGVLYRNVVVDFFNKIWHQ